MSQEGRALDEDRLLPLSALQHLSYCERQCALIHIEGQWADNPFTVDGTRFHKRTDERGARREIRGDRVVLRGVPLRSFRLGVSGRADVVEGDRDRSIRSAAEAAPLGRTPLDGLPGWWRVYPVEYKRGAPKRGSWDLVQLCAQAICLEEMLEIRIPEAALYYGKPRRRLAVVLDDDIRAETATAARRVHSLVRSGTTPRPADTSRCRQCSLVDLCMPEVIATGLSATSFLNDELRRARPVPGGD